MRGQPQLGLRRFMTTTALMSSFFGPLGPGRRRRWGENNMRYFRFFSRLWKYSRVEGFTTIAERKTQVGRTLAAAIQHQKLMPDQHRFGNHTAETARLCQLN